MNVIYDPTAEGAVSDSIVEEAAQAIATASDPWEEGFNQAETIGAEASKQAAKTGQDVMAVAFAAVSEANARSGADLDTGILMEAAADGIAASPHDHEGFA